MGQDHAPLLLDQESTKDPGGGNSHWLQYAYARADRAICASRVRVSRCRPSRGIPFPGESSPRAKDLGQDTSLSAPASFFLTHTQKSFTMSHTISLDGNHKGTYQPVQGGG